MNKVQKYFYSAIAALPTPTLPLTGGNNGAITLSEIQDRIQQIAQFLIIVAMVVAVIFVVWGALQYMLARGDATKGKDALKAVRNGLVGAGIVLAIGVLLQTVAGLVTRSFFS
ncbi:MAG: hypothetical protein A3C88_00535 [Candidatus Yanofskybacteria bacterium RIFCSPHIGHO2_02_FULL_50_12]|uniref:Uncharacterized protein n=1 Tax=Candidatus Yanofskybacteria bacterium RIFCSPHIGHO2_02_FULL_50_12 TaxID=1802685 RepID=A0A1F8FX58_9BACT|nr:MAG: hypothetical protein A3C88_00535 [Candidatus Yanofskybacteria bacterium RIFCSPHIGHO2_02_FULL_50_12]